MFCPEDNAPNGPVALDEELDLVDELDLAEELELVESPPVKFCICGVGENIGHGGAEAAGGVPCPLPGPVDMMLN